GGRERGELRLALGLGVEVAADRAVHLEEGRTEHGGERPPPGPAEDLHLEEPVLCLDVAVREEEIVEIRREDVRDAVGVAEHGRGRRVERRADRLSAGGRRGEERDDQERRSHGYLRSRPVRRNGTFAAASSLPTSTRTWIVRSV